jgi:ribosomal protein L29
MDNTREQLEKLSVEELDELVHDLKAEEAAALNNQGREAQIAYILGE